MYYCAHCEGLVPDNPCEACGNPTTAHAKRATRSAAAAAATATATATATAASSTAGFGGSGASGGGGSASPSAAAAAAQPSKKVRRASPVRLYAAVPRRAMASMAGFPMVATGMPLPAGNYALAHTMGRTRMGPHTGDGGYSHWLQDHFARNTNLQGCVVADTLVYGGQNHQIAEPAVFDEFNPYMEAEFKRFLALPQLALTNTVILNWHIRVTGRTNGQSGYGINPVLIATLQGLARAAGKKMVIVYTVHEMSNLVEKLASPSAIVSLNPDVRAEMALQFDRMRVQRFESRVPGLIRCVHGTSVDRIMDYVGLADIQETLYAAMNPDNRADMGAFLGSNLMGLIGGYADNRDVGAWGLDYTSATLLQLLQPRNQCSALVHRGTGALLRQVRGVLVFGMITSRHHLSVNTMNGLCAALQQAGLPADFRVVVAGLPQDMALVRDLKNPQLVSPRLLYQGEIDTMDDVVGCEYAISFDPLGYRPNASSMSASIRAAKILYFKTHPHESDAALIMRAATDMARREGSAAARFQALVSQQHLFRATEPFPVGQALDMFLRHVAMYEPAAPAPMDWTRIHSHALVVASKEAKARAVQRKRAAKAAIAASTATAAAGTAAAAASPTATVTGMEH